MKVKTKVFAAQIDRPWRKEPQLVVVEAEATFTDRRVILKNVGSVGAGVPNLSRHVQPLTLAEVEAGCLAFGTHEGIALGLDRETAIRTLVAFHEKRCQKAQEAFKAAEDDLRLALFAPAE